MFSLAVVKIIDCVINQSSRVGHDEKINIKNETKAALSRKLNPVSQFSNAHNVNS